MKTFEHEVLTFDASDKKGFDTMKSTLSTWGDAGFEIVSVVGSSVNASYFTVFLKRPRSVDEPIAEETGT